MHTIDKINAITYSRGHNLLKRPCIEFGVVRIDIPVIDFKLNTEYNREGHCMLRHLNPILIIYQHHGLYSIHV